MMLLRNCVEYKQIQKFLFVSKLVTLKLAGNQLMSFPNDRIDVLASLLHLDVSRNRINRLPTDLRYLYRVQQVSVVAIYLRLR